MPKLKSKSAVMKRFKVTASGLIKGKFACKQHFLRRRSKTMKRSNRGTKVLFKGDMRLIRACING